ncbi:exodeoxyribonuclease VII large subunit [Hydrogenophaga sp.]|uniref:exodeoxyribonuclease VII large subunit n=1 Tax=Hydrogenophaga sp. TaxID=1904254 RepID=UPI003F7268F4
MAESFSDDDARATRRVWAVGPLMRAVADTLAARFNPVAVRGELSGFSRAASGHCYFSLKDDGGQVRCAMFRRAADQLDFAPRDGQLVEARGKLDVYGPRGDLQLIVESLKPGGQGTLFEQFLQLKAQLEDEGLFEAARKRPLPAQPRGIGVVTSLGAAALRDVGTALRRRAPHIPVVIYPAAVQGQQAPGELCAALRTAYARAECDVLLLVRGGGSLEDLWSFNDPTLVRTIAQAPMPVVCGVGHETDFTLADFVADLRAPTPTAAAELCAPAREQRLGELEYIHERLSSTVLGVLDQQGQRLDRLAQRLGRPSTRLHDSQQQLTRLQHRLQSGVMLAAQLQRNRLRALQTALPLARQRALDRQHTRLQRAEVALGMLDPRLVLQRGYAFLTDEGGHALTRAAQAQPGQALRATLADGELGLHVDP